MAPVVRVAVVAERAVEHTGRPCGFRRARAVVGTDRGLVTPRLRRVEPRSDAALEAPEHGQPPTAWTGRRLLTIGALLVAVTATVTWSVTRGSSETPSPSLDASELDVALFDAASGTGGTASGAGKSWTAIDGSWVEEAGIVFLADAPDGDGIVTTDVGEEDHTVQVRIGGLGQCGVVVRYQDPTNFVMMFRVNPYAVWNVVEVVDGAETVLMTVDDVGSHDVDVSLTASDLVIRASVGFSTVSLVYDVAPQGSRIGLIARNEDSCTWSDVRAEQVG